MIPMFWWGFTIFMDARVAPHDSYTINVTGQRWKWFFDYPTIAGQSELHVPLNKPVELVMKSDDVLHSLFVPAFRQKMDVIPERYTKQWFTATKPGEFILLCAEYCGKDHSSMTSKVVVHPAESFQEALEKLDPLKGMTPEQWEEYSGDPEKFIAAHPEIVNLLPPTKMGELVYSRKSCAQCHSLDGSTITGPTWKGLWGRTEDVRVAATGEMTQVKVDENYIRESVLDPGAKVVKGFDPVMPTFQGKLTDREITVLIAYIKTIE
jgi:cytochrome c oxidase subunit 2